MGLGGNVKDYLKNERVMGSFLQYGGKIYLITLL